MKTKKDITGKQFGKLHVIEYGHKCSDGRIGWLCICNCGNKIVIRTNSLTSGNTKSCGCLKKTPKTNLIGKQFGRLLVIEATNKKKNNGYLVICVCDCGKEITLRKSALTSGNTKSCGCLSKEIHNNLRTRFEDLTNKRFERLVVIKEALRNKQRTMWLCKCDCGNEIILPASYLKTGDTKSCGCLRKELLLKQSRQYYMNVQDALSTQIYEKYKDSAQRRNYEFLINKTFIGQIIIKPCFYCGCEPTKECKIRGHDITIKINGIDRLHNKIGYTKLNCVPCCSICNRMKNALNIETFIQKIKEISKNRNK